MKKILSMILAISVLVLTVIVPVSAETTATPSAENAQFLYDKIVLGNDESINYSIISEYEISDPLIKNGSFEDNSGWTFRYNYAGIDENASDGNRSYMPKLNNYHTTQTINLEANQTYTLSADIWNPQNKWGKIIVWMGETYSTNSTTEVASIQFNGNGGTEEWKTAAVSFETGDNTVFTIDILLASAVEDIKIDNIKLEKAPIIKNGSFEDDGGWTFRYNYAGIDENASDGNRSYMPKLNNYHTTQTINLEANQTYTLSADIWNPQNKWGKVIVWMGETYNTTEVASIQFNGNGGTEEWKSATVSFETGENTVFTIDILLASAVEDIKIDNIKLEKAPIIKNGSFEDSTAWTWNYQYPAADETASNGLQSLSLTRYYHTTQTINLEANRTYTLSADIWNPQNKWGQVKVCIGEDRKGTVATAIQFNGNGGTEEWKTATVSFETGENTVFTIDISLDSAVTDVKVDNIKLEKKPYRKNAIEGSIISAKPDTEYTYLIAWENADGIESGKYKVTGKTRKLGDVTGNGSVDILDLIRVKKNFSNNSTDLVNDIDCDEILESDDLICLKKMILGIN